MFGRAKKKISALCPRKRGLRGLALLSVIVIISSMFCISANAATNVPSCDMPMSMPVVNGNTAYIEVYAVADWGEWFFNFYVYCNSDNAVGYVSIENGNIYVDMLGANSSAVVYGVVFGKSGNPFVASVDNAKRAYWDLGGATVKGIHYYNAYSNLPSSISSEFIVNYGSDISISNNLELINSNIENFKTQTQEQLNQILQAIIQQGNDNTQQIKDNADKNAKETQENDDKNTDKIIQNQKDLQDKEKTDAEDGGNDSSDKAKSAIPSVDGGFLTAINSLIKSMNYTGTEAKLPIPKAYIPAMAGMEEVTLISATSYDMSEAVNKFVPSTLLQLIRHLLTIALILYCLYELYHLIQYVLTLKGGNKNE